ncbi:hypothetical protein [uncultured Dokdonia sp.]|uniref:hypothetical protein n=1 Tax=uncultured Dokdonia sp. TaxID=575653 RepID=UPI00260383BB|nr:hypothetical protein [uncultured Dokdonia sp.]
MSKIQIPSVDFSQLSGTFILNDNGRYQAIYGSQNYQTYYTIYANFTFENDILQTIDLELINYKGIINMGFLNPNGGDIAVNLSEDVLVLDMPIKGMTGHTHTQIDVSSKNINISNINNINVFRLLHPLFSHSRHMENNIFDSEFFYRNGIDESPIPRKPIPGRYDYPDKNKHEGPKTFGGNCNTSYLIAISR